MKKFICMLLIIASLFLTSCQNNFNKALETAVNESEKPKNKIKLNTDSDEIEDEATIERLAEEAKEKDTVIDMYRCTSAMTLNGELCQFNTYASLESETAPLYISIAQYANMMKGTERSISYSIDDDKRQLIITKGETQLKNVKPFGNLDEEGHEQEILCYNTLVYGEKGFTYLVKADDDYYIDIDSVMGSHFTVPTNADKSDKNTHVSSLINLNAPKEDIDKFLKTNTNAFKIKKADSDGKYTVNLDDSLSYMLNKDGPNGDKFIYEEAKFNPEAREDLIKEQNDYLEKNPNEKINYKPVNKIYFIKKDLLFTKLDYFPTDLFLEGLNSSFDGNKKKVLYTTQGGGAEPSNTSEAISNTDVVRNNFLILSVNTATNDNKYINGLAEGADFASILNSDFSSMQTNTILINVYLSGMEEKDVSNILIVLI